MHCAACNATGPVTPPGTIAGPPEHCIERIQEVASIGATNIVVSQFISEQYQWMQTFADQVLPAFR